MSKLIINPGYSCKISKSTYVSHHIELPKMVFCKFVLWNIIKYHYRNVVNHKTILNSKYSPNILQSCKPQAVCLNNIWDQFSELCVYWVTVQSSEQMSCWLSATLFLTGLQSTHFQIHFSVFMEGSDFMFCSMVNKKWVKS